MNTRHVTLFLQVEILSMSGQAHSYRQRSIVRPNAGFNAMIG